MVYWWHVYAAHFLFLRLYSYWIYGTSKIKHISIKVGRKSLLAAVLPLHTSVKLLKLTCNNYR